MSTEEDIKKKNIVRAVLKDVLIKSLDDSKKLMKLEVNDENISKLESYQETIKRKFNTVKTIEKELLDLHNESQDIATLINEGMDFEVECTTKLNMLEKFLNNHAKEESTPMKPFSPNTRFRPSPHRNLCDEVKLPKLEIQRFSGDPTKWQTFYDSFKTSVHVSSLSDVQKFSYLIGYLEGDALNSISGLAPTSQNYTQALDLLQKRFGNPQIIISSHINTLVKLPAIREQDGVNGLRTFYDKINTHIRSLSTLGVASEHYGPMLSSIILEKLPPEIKLLITRNMKEDIWDLTQMLEIFNQELKARET